MDTHPREHSHLFTLSPCLLFSLSPFLLVSLSPLLFFLLLPLPASAAWSELGWPFRRAVDVEWDPQKMTGSEIAVAEFWTMGKHEPSGEVIRVTTDDGKPVPARVLMIGPGDRMRVLFAPLRGVKRHYIYFGHPKAPPTLRALADVPIRSGLLLEMRKLEGPMAGDIKTIVTNFDRAKTVIGRKMVPTLYQGFNPFGDEVQTVSCYSGTLTAPSDGTYIFAGSASDHGALYIDNRPVLWVPSRAPNVQFNAKCDLKTGPHQLAFYHVNAAGEQMVSVVWQKPGDPARHYEIIPPHAFGLLAPATVGPLEEKDRVFTADIKIEYAGECFFADHYSHRYRFTAQGAAGTSATAMKKYDWDFGDGQIATGPTAEHVYLVDGEYAVKLTGKSGVQGDTKTCRILVSRQYERIDNPPGDMPSIHGKLVATYDVAKMPDKWVPWASLLLERAKEHAALEKAATRLASTRTGIDQGFGITTLASASHELVLAGKFDAAVHMWEAVPADSPFQPFAAKEYAEVLIWRLAEFNKAARTIEPLLKKYAEDFALKRIYAQAMILSGKAPEGTKLLQELRGDGPTDRREAITGATARTIEFYITEGDFETGEKTWEKWDHQYPQDFLEGYSVMLRTRLMELGKAPEAAAKVCEAFATAIPRSSYSPRLLDRASKLLAKLDPAKSQALRKLLKEKYPEDPLSQDPK